MKLAYIVSRFPHVSETFIVREMDAVAGHDRVTIDLLSLFPPVSDTVHPIARPWLARLHRPGTVAALGALAWWLGRRPLRLLSSWMAIVVAYARNPGLLLRVLAAFPIAAAHARRLRESPVDHIHAHYATYPALCAWLCWRLDRTPYSFTAHAHDIFVDQSMLARKLGDASFAIAISEFNRDFLGRHGGRSQTPIHVVHCGIDPARFPFRPRPIGKPPAPVKAVCVASLQEYKGHAVLLDALASEDAAITRIEVELIGDGPLRAALERRAVELGVERRVAFRGGLDEDGVREAMERSDVFVLPSIVAADGQMEGLPVSIMEALACGLLVVASDLSGIPEIVQDGETGLLVKPGDPVALRKALAMAAERDAKIDHPAGRREVEREYDVHRSADRLASLFRESARPNE